ncbi:MAG: c-type cytochrome [Pseudomonadota bacterium]
MRKMTGLGLAALGLAAALAVAEAQTNVAQQIDDRQTVMKSQGGAMRGLTPIMRGEQPWNAATVLQHVTTLNTTSKRIPSLFPEGTGPDKGTTNALPQIWQKWADFQAAAKRLEDTSARLIQIAQANDEAGFKAAWPTLGQACGGCHEPFRKPPQ